MLDPITYNILDDPAYQEMFYCFQDPEILIKLEKGPDVKKGIQNEET